MRKLGNIVAVLLMLYILLYVDYDIGYMSIFFYMVFRYIRYCFNGTEKARYIRDSNLRRKMRIYKEREYGFGNCW